MLKKTTILIFGLTLCILQINAQNFKQKFNDLVSANDTAEQLVLLEKWKAADNNDPELYVAYFNFYINQSRQSFIEFSNQPKGEHSLQVVNTDTAKHEPVKYMIQNTRYQPEHLKKGFEYAEKGIAKHPTRLDIRFGKAYMYGETKDWKNFTEEIIKTIDYSAIINNKWTWTDNKPIEDPKDFLLSTIQSYQLQLYNTNDDQLLDNMKMIAEAVLKHYPDHVQSLSNLSIVYQIREDYNKAIEVLLKAKKLAPTDYIVLSNIARAYKLKGDKKKAIKYYELTVKHGDDEAKKYAQNQVKELRRKQAD